MIFVLNSMSATDLLDHATRICNLAKSLHETLCFSESLNLNPTRLVNVYTSIFCKLASFDIHQNHLRIGHRGMDCFETPGKTLQLHYALATVLQPYKSESVAHQIIHESKCYHGIGENKEVRHWVSVFHTVWCFWMLLGLVVTSLSGQSTTCPFRMANTIKVTCTKLCFLLHKWHADLQQVDSLSWTRSNCPRVLHGPINIKNRSWCIM